MATYYIATTGNDTTGNGSNSTPWLTLAKAYTSSTTGDTIMVKDGTYTFAAATMVSRTIQAVNYGSVIFDAGSTNKTWTVGGTLNINGITFQNIYGDIGGSAIFVIAAAGAQTVTFNNCIYKLLRLDGTNGKGSFAHVTSGAGANSVYIFNNCVWNNILQNASAGGSMFGVQNTDQSPYQSFTLNNCVMYFLTSGVTAITKIFGTWNAHNFTLKNTIFYNATGGTITLNDSAGTTNSVNYCCNYLMTTVPSGTGNITTDPLFVDAASGNFNLRPTSPCIDTGTLL